MLFGHLLGDILAKLWWRDAVFYQIYPRSFRDTNGDGEGDLAGVIGGLPYLQSLGIDAVWLSPFYRSPNRDGGYDISDPRDVDPRFGELRDAERLIEIAHAQNIRVIFDLVPNHFSSDHQWFGTALKSGPGSPERARFHFYDGRGLAGSQPPNNWNSIFGGPAWTRVTESDGAPGQWYLHLFDSSQPDLNWENPEVALDFEMTLRFWLDRGVDGFRIDVAHGLVKDRILVDHPDPESLTRALRLDLLDMDVELRAKLLSDIPFFDRDGVHDIYRSWRKILNSYDGDRMSVAEAWVHPSYRATRYIRSDELHQIFNFDFMIVDWKSAALKEAIQRTLSDMATVGAPATWVLNNHDSMRVISRLGGGDLGARKARALALLTQSLPGALYIYQGEELGLADVLLQDNDRQDPVFTRTKGADKGRDGCRVPLPWNSTLVNFGFTTGKPWIPIPSEWTSKTVDQQTHDPSSFLSFYRKSVALRKNHPALGGEGAITWLPAPEGILQFSREPGLTVVVNTTDSLTAVAVPVSTYLLHESIEGTVVSDGYALVAGNSTVWLQA